MKHSKFEFRDFSRQPIVHAPKLDLAAMQQEKLIVTAVTEALAENTPIQLESSLVHNMNSSTPPPPIHKEKEIDVEAISAESYKNGYNDAKAHFEPLIQNIKDDNTLSELLKLRLEAVTQTYDLKDQVFRLSASIVSALAQKLHLAIPTDFEKVLLGEMMSILNKYYKSGEITIKINPERVDYCQNLLKIRALPEIVAQNVKLVSDEGLGKSACVLSWNETELEYSQEQIIADSDGILEHLKNGINN
jgi:hypothetical protein